MEQNWSDAVDMLLVLGECHQNASQAARIYAERYPERHHPDRRSFSTLCTRLRQTGRVDVQYVRPRSATSDNVAADVLAAVAVFPHASSRQIARGRGVSPRSILRILRRHRFHPYHVSLHQELLPADFHSRVMFCGWGLEQAVEFWVNVLFSDEATFTNHGQLNRHNMHYWSDTNPHWLRQAVIQRPWSVNVWCGIYNGQIIGPYFFDGHLTGGVYNEFLTTQLPILLEDVPLHNRHTMWYQHDGCPAHNAGINRQELNTTFPGRWIGRGGPVHWPARSPDLTPLDYYLWGYLKDQVYRTEPTTREDMKQRIRQACANIPQEQLVAASQSITTRMQLCLNQNGQHFEHLL